MIQVMVFCLCFHPEDRDSKVLKHTGIIPHYYMVSEPRRPKLGYLPRSRKVYERFIM
jgi:hypothetical protein